MRSLDFTPADLDRYAALGPNSLDGKRAPWAFRQFFIATALPILLFGYAGMWLWNQSANRNPDGSAAIVCLTLVLLGVTTGLLSMLHPWLMRRFYDHAYESIDGKLSRSEVQRTERVKRDGQHVEEQHTYYQVQVGDMLFEVSKNVYNAFEAGLPYRVFYSLGSHRIVAAEVLIPG